jgi:iron complex transport system substrate-binding protein
MTGANVKKIFFIVLLCCSTICAENGPKRIISLAPSITEILCSLGLQERIAGVTDFCIDPYKKTNFTEISVGSLLSPNFERILKAKPDLILTLKGKSSHTVKLRQFGLKVLELNHINLDAIMSSIQTIGDSCEVSDRSNKLIKELNASLIKEDILKGKKVLLTITRLSSLSNIRLWVAGNDGFYSRLLNTCGGQNAYTGKNSFAQISAEALIQTNPDVIIFITNKLSEEEILEEKNFWKKNFPTLKAVKNNQYLIITGDEMLIPGPRFPSILTKLKKALKK